MTTTKTITVQRWYHNPEIWLNVVSAGSIVASAALVQIGLLGLDGPYLFWATISLTGVVNVANIVIKMLSKTVVASAKTIEAIQDMDDGPNVETAASNNKGTAATVELKTNPGGR